MSPHTSHRLVALSLVGFATLLAGSPLAAQARAEAYSIVNHAQPGVFPRPIDCQQGPVESSTSASTAITCALSGGNTGTGSSSASATAATRSLSATAELTVTAGTTAARASAAAWLRGSITFDGLTDPGELFFSYLLTHSENSNGTAFSWGDAGIQLHEGNINPSITWTHFSDGRPPTQEGPGSYDGTHALLVTPFDPANGPLFFSSYLQADGDVNDYRSGATGYGYGTISARLENVYARDAEGNLIGTAVFDENGDAIIAAGAIVTPEPASMTLLATGLVAIVGAARRRRKQIA